MQQLYDMSEDQFFAGRGILRQAVECGICPVLWNFNISSEVYKFGTDRRDRWLLLFSN